VAGQMPIQTPWERLKSLQKELPNNFLEINNIRCKSEYLIDVNARGAFDEMVQFLINYLHYYKNKSIDEVCDFLMVSRSQYYNYRKKGEVISGYKFDHALRKARLQFGEHFENLEPSDQTRNDLGNIILMKTIRNQWFIEININEHTLTIEFMRMFSELHASGIIGLGAWISVNEQEWFRAIRKFPCVQNMSDSEIVDYIVVWIKPFLVIATLASSLLGLTTFEAAERR
jgi:hypothetical protein